MHWFLVVLSSTPQPHVDHKAVGILAVRILNFVTFSLTAAQIILVIKGAMSPNTHARANEDKLEKDSPTFSSCVGDFGRLFLSV